ncbi:MAG TPA: hypothetical protein VM686_26615 [Polyangiaceae bacterium]|nr:hypothetical protein [Polyangiaceae bacterium]
MPKGQASSTSETKSQLKTGAERFLAQAVGRALDDHWRTPEDFLRHFKPLDIMTGLEKAPDLRATLLVKGAGVHEKIARKKSTSSAAEDLRIALDEQVTSPAEVLALFPADDRVRFLERQKLWAFVTEDQFWTNESQKDRGFDRMAFFLNTALGESLITLQDLTDGVTFETISKRLPLAELQKVVLHALKTGRGKSPLSEESLLEVVPLRDLISYIPLDHIWKRVVVAKVAQPAGFTAGAGAPGEETGWDSSPGAESKAAKAEHKAEPKVEKVEKPEKVEKVERVEAKPAPKAEEPKPAEPVQAEAADTDAPGEDKAERSSPPPKPIRESLPPTGEDVDQLLHSSRSAPEEEARRRVTDRLRAINRLPPRHEDLTTAIMLSIESMYADLLSASTDEAREMCIRESFPNDQQLAAALLALIELLDPSIDVNDPVIKDADADSLIKVVLFEERHRYEQAHPSARPASSVRPPPPPPAGTKSGRALTPPPLPRVAPPPLPDKR